MRLWNGPNSYSNIDCNIHCEYPVEHLFKAIYILQPMAECQHHVEAMKQQLHEYLMMIPETEGKRVYGREIIYYPTGLCTWDGTWNIFLPGYESTYEPPEPEKKPKQVETQESKKKRKTTNRKFPVDRVLREADCLIWYVQLRKYRKKKISISEDQKYPFKELRKQYEVYHALSKEEKDMLDKEFQMSRTIQNYTYEVVRPLLKHVASPYPSGSNDLKQYRYQIPLLFEDELEELEAFCAITREKYLEQKTRYYSLTWSQVFRNELPGFLEKIDINREGRIVLDLSKAFSIETKTEVLRYYNSKERKYEDCIHQRETVECNLVDALVPQLEAIENETIRDVLAQVGLL